MNIWIKRILKIVAVLVAIVLLLGGCGLYFLLHVERRHSDDIAYYQALSGEIDGPTNIGYSENGRNVSCPYDLPLLSELEPCEEYRFRHDDCTTIVATDFTYILIVSYDEENYQSRKTALDTQYTYRTELIPGLEEDDRITPEFEMDGFYFRAVDQVGVSYPKEMLFVGTSDETQEIAYIYCDNYDLDCISDSMEAHVKDVSRWEKLVK